MRKRTPTIEWHIAENEADWARLATMQTDQTTALTDHHLSFYKNACWTLAISLGLLVTLSGWWWHNAPTAKQRTATDYESLVTDLVRELARPIMINDSRMLTGIPTGALDKPLEPAIVLVEAQGDQAVVSVVTAIKAGRPICREQRFYRHSASGWQQTRLDEKALASLRQQKTASLNRGSVCNYN